jgi:HAD superfamily hydrolase (TIGR01490 family)
MKCIIAAFDFDGTITDRDTLWEFIKRTHRPLKILMNLVLVSPYLLLYKSGLMDNGTAKQKLFARFYKNWDIDEFDAACASFKPVIDACVRPEICREFKCHLNAGHKVIIVSASVENWILPWAAEEGVDAVLATRIEVSPQGRLTGRFSSRNCYGREKVQRILERFPERDSYTLIAYGDSRGDAGMLNMADTGHKLY